MAFKYGRRIPTVRFPFPLRENDNATLMFLGRRVERLFFTSFLMTALSFAAMYVTSANLQATQDRSVVAISTLLPKMQQNKSRLNQLFNEMKSPSPESVSQQKARKNIPLTQTERIARSRELLGLPPEPPPEGADAPEPQTYSAALDRIFSDAVRVGGASDVALKIYHNANLPPDDIIKALSNDQANLEKQPYNVLGVRMPRLIAVQYAGSNFQFPYEFLSLVMIGLLSPLLAGWLSTLYMTRQRELFEIYKTRDFTNVFPHVLNFVPLYSTTNMPKQAKAEWGMLVYLSLVRTIALTVLIAPMLVAYFVSIYQFWDKFPWQWILSFFCLYISIQTLVLIAQHIVGTGRKFFAVTI